MHLSYLYPTLLTLLSLAPGLTSAVKTPKNAILLSNVKSLTLYSNAKTTHRRVAAVPQLNCNGPACKHYKIDTMRCVNTGSSYNEEDIEWSCSANMPHDFKLGSTKVICEGYANSDDPFVLKGSCGVEYRLLYTDKGEEKFGKNHGGWGGDGSTEGSKTGKWLFIIIFIGVLAWIIISALRNAAANGGVRMPRVPRGNGGGWGGGFGGGGDPWDPPPPYPGKRSYGTTGGQEGWRPGFWSGTAAGAAAGYMAGRGGQQQQQQQLSSSLFGSSNSNRSGSSRSNSSASSSRHESTGFGSTSRR